MTMLPHHHLQYHQQNLTSKKSNSFSCEGGGRSYYDSCSFISLGGGESNNNLMATDQDEFRIEIISNSSKSIILETAGQSSSTSSKDDDHHIITHPQADIINKEHDNKDHDDINHRRWLQLSLGTSTRPDEDDQQQHQILLVPRLAVELELLPTAGSATSSGGGETCSSSQTQTSMMMQSSAPPQLSFQVPDFRGTNIPITTASASTFFLQSQPSSGARAIDSVSPTMTNFTHHQQQFDNMNYIPFIRPNYHMLTLSSTPSFSASILHQLPVGSQHGQQRPFHFNTSGSLDAKESPMLHTGLRVVDPPPRPLSSGVWFDLQASPNQTKQPYLPQLPKRYLRIKNGRANVRLLIKYLVNKLNLASEFELEITCKGRQLLPLLTLQHVRDKIWNSPRNDVVFPHSSSATIAHLMVLNYGRIA